MDYLALCNALRKECRIPGAAMTAVTGHTGALDDIVRWIAQAWTDIQTDHDGRWRWLRKSFTFNTTASDDQYAYGDITDVETSSAITRFTAWRITDKYNPPKIYLTSGGVGGQRWLVYRSWDTFNLVFKIGTQNNGAPVFITEDPAQNIVLGPIPGDTYTVTGEYWKGPQTLTLTTDEPECPSQFHMVIVYRAMIDYGYNEVAPERLARAEERYAQLLARLETNQGAFMQFRTARPLVG